MDFWGWGCISDDSSNRRQSNAVVNSVPVAAACLTHSAKISWRSTLHFQLVDGACMIKSHVVLHVLAPTTPTKDARRGGRPYICF